MLNTEGRTAEKTAACVGLRVVLLIVVHGNFMLDAPVRSSCTDSPIACYAYSCECVCVCTGGQTNLSPQGAPYLVTGVKGTHP